MPKINVSKSIEIDAPVSTTYKAVNDLNNWQQWSPWLIMEPEAKVEVAADAKYYSWDGKRTGTGNMKITDEKENEFVDYDLTFLTPWKSFAKVRFELSGDENKSKATWIMDSSLPFFMFWMKKMMTAFIGMDFQRGLFLLKDYAEDGEVHSKLDFKGSSNYEGCTFIGVKTDCSMAELSNKMSADFNSLMEYADKHKDNLDGKPFSIYHKWDMTKGKVSYTSAVPVKMLPPDLPSGFVHGNIAETKVYTLRHTGAYKHLGNAWSTLYNMQRSKSFKVKKNVHPFEVYHNLPGEVPDNELVTEINFPIK